MACVPKTRWAICLQATLGIQLLLVLAFEVQIALKAVPSQSGWYQIPSAMTLAQIVTAVFESCYQLVLGFNAVRMRNVVTAIGICINNASTLVLIIIVGLVLDLELGETTASIEEERAWWPELEKVKVVSPGVFKRGFGGLIGTISLCTFAVSFATYKLYGQFAWDIYRHIATADLRLRRRYLMYEIYISLLHLDFFFLFGFWLQFMAGMLFPWTTRMGSIMLLVAPFQLFLAGRLVRREKRWGSALTILLLMVQIAVVGYAVAWLLILGNPRTPQFRTTAYAWLAFPCLLATVAMTIVCTMNFGKGLKPFLSRNQVTEDTRGSVDSWKRAEFGEGFEYQALSRPAPARMEID